MPSNPYKEERNCIIYLNRFFRRLPNEGISRDYLIWDIRSRFAVSQRFINNFIDFQVESGVIDERGGMLYGKQDADRSTVGDNDN